MTAANDEATLAKVKTLLERSFADDAARLVALSRWTSGSGMYAAFENRTRPARGRR